MIAPAEIGAPLRAVIIDDEPAARDLLVEMLSAMPEVTVAGTHEDVGSLLRSLDAERPDVLFVDIRLARATGLDLVGKLRALDHRAAVVFVTAYEEHARQAFDVGATDYVMKPVDERRLRQAVERVLARSAAEAERDDERAPSRDDRGPTVPSRRTERFGDVQVDRAAHAVTRGGARVPLRPLEYRLLIALLDRAGTVVTREALLQEVWGYDPDVASRTLDIHIKELRRKLEPDPAAPRHFVTVRTVGYRLDR